MTTEENTVPHKDITIASWDDLSAYLEKATDLVCLAEFPLILKLLGRDSIRTLIAANAGVYSYRNFKLALSAQGELLGILNRRAVLDDNLADQRHAFRDALGPAGWLSLNFRSLLQRIDLFEVYEPRNAYHVEHLAVAEDQQGRGIGSLLLEHACTEAREASFPQIDLEVLHSNTGAQRLYESFGFVREREVFNNVHSSAAKPEEKTVSRFWRYEDSFWMAKQLP